MPILFTCNACGKSLNVKDEYAGKRVKCPACGSPQDIQASPIVQPMAYDPEPNPGPPSTVNPYASSYVPSEESPSPTVSSQVIDIGAVFNYAFKKWQEHVMLLSVSALIIFLISFGFSFGMQFLIGIMESTLPPDAAWMTVAVAVISQIFANAFQVFIQIGFVRQALHVLRGGAVEMPMLFSGMNRFLPVLGFSILFGLAAGVGFILLIVPGVLVLLIYWPAYYLVVDRKTPVFASFRKAREISTGNWLNSFVIGLIVMGVNMIGFMACCVGIIPAMALAGLLWGTAYLTMIGEINPAQLMATLYAPPPPPGNNAGSM